MSYPISFKRFGQSAILIEWPDKIEESVIRDIIEYERLIRKEQKVLDTIIAYNSLTVVFKNWDNYSDHYKYRNLFERTVKKMRELYNSVNPDRSLKSRLWHIPVCYDLKFGRDLEEISNKTKLSIDEIIKLHSKPTYLIYFIGFQPGFLYLGGLDAAIHIPRRNTPRLRVEKGSVGIGGEQTGIYPHESAGGWNIIGRSPIDFFNISMNQPCFAKAGDRVQFESVSLNVFKEISEVSAKSEYTPKYNWL